MANSLKTFTKAELFEILDAKCPDALNSFPPPEAFEFVTKTRDGKDAVALKIGHHVTQSNRIVRNELYLEEYDTASQATGGAAPPPRLGEVRLFNDQGPFTYTCLYGKAIKNEERLQKLYQHLFYTTIDDAKMNMKIKNAKGFLGTEVFGKLNATGILRPWSDTIRALYRFVLVHCNHKENFEEFENANGNRQGVNALVRGLKKIAERTSIADGSEDVALHEEDYDEDSCWFRFLTRNLLYA
ncbi:uncharacterized protein K460DRAFT_157839 [Cucurbitaria berberidis CBS 394.84]|uniref:Uncharacterized protein n=1 Tax=Cucurbitaria berberidis CBS 394.84 TaxID=1168544 RepID=A0A9P4L7A7_9PLEO|nr:uncharacterized protein K460DRAFT_157839 [Cucurbitaria berberidis CBS 394.84]KAF1844117.1 hypothetical protein K460DRAFT_157839 [Cucurbitaria berberidis CBS 394.84]